MKIRSQWLFEVPPLSESDRYANLEYYGNPESEWDLSENSSYSSPLPGEEKWQAVSELESSRSKVGRTPPRKTLVTIPRAAIPKEGHFYQIKQGDTLLKIASKAYGVGSGAELHKLARLINKDPYNLRFRRPEPVELFPEGIISFYPEFTCDANAQIATKGKPPVGKCYGIIFIPPKPKTPAALKPSTSLILEFRNITVTPIGLRRLGTGFKMGGQFRVILRLNPSLNCSQFEYRQFIKGRAIIQPGKFSGKFPSFTNWSPSGPIQDVSQNFAIPGGLKQKFTEDGQVLGGRTYRYGYRSAAPVYQRGLEDRYLPLQKTGCEYRALDTYGIEGNRLPVGLRIRLNLEWEGRVIDISNQNRIIATRQWDVHGDAIIT